MKISISPITQKRVNLFYKPQFLSKLQKRVEFPLTYFYCTIVYSDCTFVSNLSRNHIEITYWNLQQIGTFCNVAGFESLVTKKIHQKIRKHPIHEILTLSDYQKTSLKIWRMLIALKGRNRFFKHEMQETGFF